MSFFFSTPAQAAFLVGVDATPGVVAPGGSTTLHWWAIQGVFPYSCDTADSLGASAHFDILEGNQGPSNPQSFAKDTTASPSSTTTYSIKCTDATGASFSRSTTVEVSTTPVFTFSCSTGSGDASSCALPAGGGTVYIRWSRIELATSCTASGGDATWRGMSNFMSGGNVSFRLTATTSFTLECSNAAGSSSKSVSVTVAGTPPPAAVCGNTIIETGETCDDGLSQNGVCPKRCSVDCQPNTCGPGGPVPTLGFWGNKSEVAVGQPVTLNWKTTLADTCTRKAVTPAWNGDIPGFSSSQEVIPGDGKTTGRFNFYLYCTNNNGSTPHDMFGMGDMVAVNVTNPPVIDRFSAVPNKIDVGQSSTLEWRVSNADGGCALYEGKTASGRPIWSGSGTTTTSKVVSPTVSTYYTLECTNSVKDASGRLSRTSRDEIVRINGTVDPAACTGGSACKASCSAGESATGTCTGGSCCKAPDASTCTGGAICKASCGVGESSTGTCSTGSCCTSSIGSISTCQNKDAQCRSLLDCQGDSTQVGSCNNGLGVCCLTSSIVSTPTLTTVSVKNPLAFDTVEGLLNSILGFLQGAIVILSLIMIVIGAMVYMTAAGDEKRVSTGKTIITAALVGLALAIAAPSFLKEIGTILDWGGVDGSAVTGAKTLAQIATSVLNFLLSVVGVIGIIMMVVGGLMYLTAAGDEDRIKTGKSITVYSIIGIAIALAALVLVTQIATFF
ncbi:MAG: pilin [Candidatus Moraniibacteriota bacterium]